MSTRQNRDVLRKKVKKTKRKKAAGAARAAGSKPSAPRPSAVAVKHWALKHETLSACEAGEGLSFELAPVLGRYKTLAAAWERGQFLRKLKASASTTATLEQIEFDLGLAEGSLAPQLEKDAEAREMYNHARFATINKVQAGIVAAVEAGRLSPTSLKQLDTFLRMQIVTKDVDFDKVPTAVMEDLFGVTRQTLINWKKTRGLTGSLDGTTYDLRDWLRQGWTETADGVRQRVPGKYEQLITDKVSAQPGKYAAAAQNDADWLRAEKARRQLAVMDKELIRADAAMAALVARAAAINQYIAAVGEGLNLALADRTPEQIRDKLAAYHAGLREASCRLPPNFPELLPEAVAVKFMEIMQDLAAGVGGRKQSLSGKD
jgi:hypothetical protein